MTDLKLLALRIHSVSVMRELLDDRVVGAVKSFLDLNDNAPCEKKIDAYSQIAHALYSVGTDDLGAYIKRIVFESENIYVRTKGRGEIPSVTEEKSLHEDLVTFGMISSLTSDELAAHIGEYDFLPGWRNSAGDILTEYTERAENIDKYGYGIYAKYRMFYIGGDNTVVPVKNPDSTRLYDLVDYKNEQKIIMDNTRALLCGKPAANILLTGDAGTGKSSTIKACVNELYSEGLRIIEVRKEQLHGIPHILDLLSENPLKFILFIDDLSFSKDDDNFSALKAILEGSVSAKSRNVVIYATSNRRHLVKESFSDREGDDVHFNDTMQEILSLSERFGIRLTFSRPDKKTYLDIVHDLADKHLIKYTPEKLDSAAEKYALARGTRSARAAKQFIDGIASGSIADIL